MKYLLIFLVAVIVQDCYHYGAFASPSSSTQAESATESAVVGGTDKKAKKGGAVFVSSSSSSSSGPNGPVWTTMYSGPDTGGSVVSFSNVPVMSSAGELHSSTSESSSSGSKMFQSISSSGDSGSVFAQSGSIFSDEDDDIMMPFKKRSMATDVGVRSRLLGGSNSRSGLLGLGVLGLL